MSTFMTLPYCYVAGGDQNFMVYRHVSEISFKCIINVLTRINLRVNFKTSGNSALVSVPTDHMNSLKDVRKEITKQTKGKEMFICFQPVTESHYSHIMQR